MLQATHKHNGVPFLFSMVFETVATKFTSKKKVVKGERKKHSQGHRGKSAEIQNFRISNI
jgi:hypothetical protein